MGNTRSITAAILFAAALGNGPSHAEDEIPTAQFEVTGFAVTGDNPLDGAETTALLDDYTGSHQGLDGLLAAADALESAILSRGHSFHRVVLPPQTLAAGVVTLEVVTFQVGDIQVTGNEHFPEEQVLKSLPPLRTGTVPSTRDLSRALRVANEHPARQISLKFRESEAANTIDAAVEVEDDRPWQVVAGLANNGTEESGRLRLSVALQHSNVFDLDHIATVSYVTSPEGFGSVQQRAVSYQVPFYEHFGRLSAFYVDSSVDTGVIDGIGIAGSGRFWGVSFRHELPKHDRYRHWVSAGYENKFFDNDVTLGTTSLVPDVRSTPLIASYGGEFPIAQGLASFSVSVASNLGNGSKNDDADYAASRAGAESRWKALRLRSDLDYPLKGGWALHGLFEGQWADDPLIGGEQYGLGGAQSVRGLEERDTSGDSGYRMSLELWAPATPHNTRFLGFVDAGKVWNEQNQLAFLVDDDFVATWGLGLRWQPGPRVNVAVDVSHALEGTSVLDPSGAKVSSTKDGHKQVHANVSVRF